MDQNRKSRMEKAEGSRENVRGSASERQGSSGQRSSIGERLRETERMRGSGGEDLGPGSSGEDLGTSSDRAMWESDRTSSGSSGAGSSTERTRGGTTSGSERGGITNRDLESEQSEQERLPNRGRSQSER